MPLSLYGVNDGCWTAVSPFTVSESGSGKFITIPVFCVSVNLKVMLATPHKFSTMLQEEVLNILLTRLQVKAANIVNQSLLTPYLYNATSGIVVDIGERIDIVAITDGKEHENKTVICCIIYYIIWNENIIVL